ncbi:hypothetical protein GN956_G6272 [Arapaima gigas]
MSSGVLGCAFLLPSKKCDLHCYRSTPSSSWNTLPLSSFCPTEKRHGRAARNLTPPGKATHKTFPSRTKVFPVSWFTCVSMMKAVLCTSNQNGLGQEQRAQLG